MKESGFRPLIRQFLGQFGFEVLDIDTNEKSKSPDFEVIGQSEKYTLELKIKGDDPIEVQNDEDAILSGELVSKSTPVGPRNTMSGIIREGVKQLLDYDPDHRTYHIIWLHSTGQDPELLNTRFHSTLYGTEKLYSLRKSNLITCYYFHNSAFYSWRNNLDGVILSHHDKIQLCINTLSPWEKEFHNAHLTVSMADGLCDPKKLEALYEDIFIADCDIDRIDQNEVLKYLQNKYGLDHLQTIPMSQNTASIALPTESES